MDKTKHWESIENISGRPRRSRLSYTLLLLLALVLLISPKLSRDLLCHIYPPAELFSGDTHSNEIYHNRPAVEREFLKYPSETSALASSRHYASKPHIAGSAQDLVTAKDILSHLQSHLGITIPDTVPIFDAGSIESQSATRSISSLTAPTAWIDTYYPVLNAPLDRSLEILDELGNVIWEANLAEQVEDDTDPLAFAYADAVPAFHGLSKQGTAKGSLVYANLGRKEDYDSLVASGVDLKDKVVIVRYGGIFRGLKVKFAQELGAAAVLIYSDPKDDGSVTISNGYKPYPHGPARNPSSVQRGSVQFLSLYPGDPTTPGYPSYPNATRTKGLNIPEIPSLPISWLNAQRLFEEFDVANPGKSIVRVTNNVNTTVTPIWNTIGVIPGQIKNEIVVIGNHRDAWVMGAADPTSGTASMAEIIRGYGALLLDGWTPLRTVMFVSWDAEEYGLIGSTEYGEDFADWIRENVVAYINLDSSVAGSRFHSSASPLLADLVRDTAMTVSHPNDENRTLWDAREDVGKFLGPKPAELNNVYAEEVAPSTYGTGVGPLGSGSDYTVFLQRIGVASIDQGFGSTLSDAVYHYHSVYDSQRWQEVYADPGFHKHVTMAKHVGLLGLRIADTHILPFNTTRYCTEFEIYIEKVAKIMDDSGIRANLAPLSNSIKGLLKASIALDIERGKIDANRGSTLRYGRNRAHDSHIRSINRRLASFERGFISLEGIKDREWYRHLATAPGKNLGYGATTLPALTEAIALERNATLAGMEVARLVKHVENLTTMLLSK